MPAVGRKGDSCTGHGCFPPRASISGCDWVTIEEVDALRVGDGYASHRCGKTAHSGSQAAGSSLVFIEDVPVARIGDGVDCGSALAQGSDFVFAD